MCMVYGILQELNIMDDTVRKVNTAIVLYDVSTFFAILLLGACFRGSSKASHRRRSKFIPGLIII
jgi:hypothetical protein